MIDAYADSTIAMSAYNVLAMSGGGTLDEVLESIRTIANPGVGAKQLRLALDGLLERQLVVKAPVGVNNEGRIMYRVKDPRRRIVKERDRSDITENKKADGWVGGWNGWQVEDSPGILIPVEEVAR